MIKKSSSKLSALKEFLQTSSAGGIVLAMAAMLAMIVANTPLYSLYESFFSTLVSVQVGDFEISKPFLLWINDGLMAIFFFLVGLELKREFIAGELSNINQIMLPALAAVGGMIVPALIYLAFNQHDEMLNNGWAIPAATDIAFALGILSLLGDRVPTALKVFLVTVAIFDDIGAIVIIALFYTEHVSWGALGFALLALGALWGLHAKNVTKLTPYMVMGGILWVAVLKSGVHATLAGVLAALFIPYQNNSDPSYSPVLRLEHDLHSTVAFFILPLFAFANAGIGFSSVGMEELLHTVPLGIFFGLVLGKPLGVLLLCWLGVVCRVVKMPSDLNWKMIIGASMLCGVGFTMSLFIGGLAFEAGYSVFDERLGIVFGSLVAGIMGYTYLKMVLPPKA